MKRKGGVSHLASRRVSSKQIAKKDRKAQRRLDRALVRAKKERHLPE